MAFKAQLFDDEEIRWEILKCNDPKLCRDLGRRVRGFAQTVWDKFKYLSLIHI